MSNNKTAPTEGQLLTTHFPLTNHHQNYILATFQFAPGSHWIGGWAGARAGLDNVEKILDPTGTRTPTPLSSSQQPVAMPTELPRLLALGIMKCDYAAENTNKFENKLIFVSKLLSYKLFVILYALIPNDVNYIYHLM
jgi:hypothetical protein